MAIAKFHSLRGEKSALVLVRANKFVFNNSPVYIPREALPNKLTGLTDKQLNALAKDDSAREFEIPDGFTLVDIVDYETGEIRQTTDGAHLKQLSYQ